MSLKKMVLRYAPVGLRRTLRDVYFAGKLVPGHLYDYGRFLSHAGLNKSRNAQAERAARITLYYHQLEKGMSLAEPRLNFGKPIIASLFDELDVFLAAYGVADPATTAVAALFGYVDFHEARGERAEHVRAPLDALLARHGITTAQARAWRGGVVAVTRADIAAARDAGFKRFFESRYSIRQFGGGAVALEDLRSAVATAQKTPSVCNRQSWQVHAFVQKDKMAELLAIQSGSRGFGDQASAVLVITSDLRSFLGIGERYQAWIDGGMFAMSMCLALHDLGYGSCCLNWSKEPDADKAMRAAAGVKPHEQIIMLLAVGTLPDSFSVAASYRPPVDQVLVVHG